MLRVAVKRTMLDWAMTRAGTSVKELSKKNDLQSLSKWLDGDAEPTVRQIERFASATYVPFGYMLLSKPPDEKLPIPYYRTQKSSPTPRARLNLMKIIQIIEQRQVWMREYLIQNGAEPLIFVGSASQTDLPQVVARDIRKNLGMTEYWTAQHRTWEGALNTMRKKIEKKGICVSINGQIGHTKRRLDPEVFRGFVMVDEYVPFVFVNGSDGQAAQMFTLAHELAHIWLGHSAAFDLHRFKSSRGTIEAACNKIAAEVVVPEDEMRKNWNLFAKSDDPCSEAASHFKVSKTVAAIRALGMNLINRNEFDRIYQEEKESQKQRKEEMKKRNEEEDKHPPIFYPNLIQSLGKLFANNVINAVNEGSLSYTKAYSLTDTTRNSFDGLAAKMDQMQVG